MTTFVDQIGSGTTLLTLVQRASAEMGLGIPNFVIGNTTPDVVQTLYLINAVGQELSREYPWEALNKEYRFTTQYTQLTGTTTTGSAVVTGLSSTTGLDTTYMVSGTGINQDTYISTVDSATQVTLTQSATASGTVTLTFGKTKYDMPSDYDRQIDRTHYDKSKRWEMLGPETPQQWQFLKSSYISTGPRLRYRIMGQYFQIWPQMSTNEYLGLEYISENWVNNGLAATFTDDSDTCIYPDRLIILGLKKKYFEVKGFDATYFERDYQRELAIAKANDQGSPTLSLAPRPATVLIGWENIPDSNYGS